MPPKLIDTFPIFQEYWLAVRGLPVSVQIDRWMSDLMAHWPKLLEKQLNDYADQQLDWRKIAQERVFPYLNSRLESVQAAGAVLRSNFPPIAHQMLLG